MKIPHCNCLTLTYGHQGKMIPVEEKDGFCVHCGHAVVYSSSHDRYPRNGSGLLNGYRPLSTSASVWSRARLTHIFNTLREDAYPEASYDETPLSEDLYVVNFAERSK